MSALVELVRSTPRTATRGFAISAGELADRPVLRHSLAAAGLRLLVAANLPVEQALRALGDGGTTLVLVDAGARTGAGLVEFVHETVARLSTVAPYAGVAVLSVAPVSARLLPPRTWAVDDRLSPVDVEPMLRAVQEHRDDRETVLRPWPPHTRLKPDRKSVV